MLFLCSTQMQNCSKIYRGWTLILEKTKGYQHKRSMEFIFYLVILSINKLHIDKSSLINLII